MPDIEGGKEYKNKHPKAIHLNTYRGVACNLMSLNEPAADRFMQVSDIRTNIVIIQKPQDRVKDYDDIGFVRVAKFLKMPRLDFWHNGNGILQIKREDRTWYIAINDQDLADQVARKEGDNRRFDDRFVDAFRTEVRGGLTSYHGLISFDLVVGPMMIAVSLLNADPESAAKSVALVAIANTAYNGLSLVGAGLNWAGQRIFGSYLDLDLELNAQDFNDPFVRRSIPELLLPPVPVDRLIRGLNYLSRYGDELIRKELK